MFMATSQISRELPRKVFLNLNELSSLSAQPPRPPTTRYYYSNVVAKNISYIYRVVKEGDKFVCSPEAGGWPRLILASSVEIQQNFKLLVDDDVVSKKFDPRQQPGQVRFPDLEELRLEWQVGSDVYFRYCDVMTPGKVAGRFIWRQHGSSKKLRLVLLLQLPTNELILSSQGISLISVVAALIANVAYMASVSPIRGNDVSRHGVAVASYFAVPKVFLFFNAFAFYASVLAVVLMAAFIPIYGTAGEWGAIFLSGSAPVVLSLVAFYVAYMVSAWAVLDSWGTSLGITLVGVLMVVYMRFWATELMHGNIDTDLKVAPRSSPWDWYNSRLESGTEIVPVPPASHSCFTWHRLSQPVSCAISKIRQFVSSPTIWQVSVLSTVPESQKSRNRRQTLLMHLENTR
ncbi:uncharacterized protein [Physcomitrium patens]|uniref:PGG domain-containing protein n=1 Tax=Physcomitrium patens TaxID=3218 RepID=A0A2K1ISL1_PHYPA|nr:uncharacterized protein LOC112274057 isoform X2 [Physcomitrium patens]PNR32267.1 hypothetical protein PHYPA_026393 [Physcomitrium patens]|eukprot:XP_024358976.1 uncharacterized protein LOC112274057 isoform X2 [Physcomitrella patens]